MAFPGLHIRMGAPAILLGSLDQASLHWISGDVFQQLIEIPGVGDQGLGTAAAVDSAGAIVFLVVIFAVGGVQALDSLADGDLSGFQQQVIMIVHEDKIQDLKPAFLPGVQQQLEEVLLILYVFVDVIAIVPPLNDVVQPFAEEFSRFSSHTTTLCNAICRPAESGPGRRVPGVSVPPGSGRRRY